MPERRKLTAEEKQQVEKEALRRAYEKNTDGSVEVIVGDEIDEEGKVSWRTLTTTETMIPPHELPWNRR